MENQFRLKALVTCLCVATLAGSATAPAYLGFVQCVLDVSLLQEGDIIFRRGTDSISKAILTGDSRANYSHVGLIIMRGKEAFVVHAIPAETQGEQDAVKIEPLSVFVSASRAAAIAVLRLRNGMQANYNVSEVVDYATSRVGRPFDYHFDDSEDSSLYCTELVWRAYLAAGVQIINPSELQSLPLISRRIIPPSAIWNATSLEEVNVLLNSPPSNLALAQIH